MLEHQTGKHQTAHRRVDRHEAVVSHTPNCCRRPGDSQSGSRATTLNPACLQVADRRDIPHPDTWRLATTCLVLPGRIIVGHLAVLLPGDTATHSRKDPTCPTTGPPRDKQPRYKLWAWGGIPANNPPCTQRSVLLRLIPTLRVSSRRFITINKLLHLSLQKT